ncbi:hypothetical protein BT96DRAFT_387764 [Gymnopus androsaceus JB14]|uniref:DUF6699 domain-containing protein n=1 Tax=Gymnopus androsaceus JB14 TaxID=1447944 RepID=A0A6A4I549_9AGAR|nr:hypothetical protein BT96DRAFT_387764 [Gymnopus androsaceus JB14]
MSKTVHWATSNEQFSATPHSPTSSGSPEPFTPPPALPGAVTISDSLRFKSSLGFTIDLSREPGEWSLDSSLSHEAATAPPISQVDIVCSKLPLIIHIRETKEEMGLTVGNLLRRLYLALREKMSEEEMERDRPENREAIQKAFEERCDKELEHSIPRSLEEKAVGIRRIDCLRGHCVFAGFDVVLKEIPTLRLHVR